MEGALNYYQRLSLKNSKKSKAIHHQEKIPHSFEWGIFKVYGW
jgi:hypothetical protein